MTGTDYSAKDRAYFRHSRQEIRPLLNTDHARVLDVGCGAGHTLRWIKSIYPNCETVGIEIEPANEAELGRNADRYLIADVERVPDLDGPFDLMLFLDVLEHLRSPEQTLAAFCEHLSPEGVAIISVPAVSYIGVSLPLLLFRRFEYADAGILDRTHTRLFVEATSVALANSAGLVVEAGLLAGLSGPKASAVNALTLGLFKHHLTKQYIIRCRRSAARQGKVRWGIARKLQA